MALRQATNAPDLWNQQSYLARVLEFSTTEGITDRGAVPLAHFADAGGADSAAITIETDASGDIHPALYVRRNGEVAEHLLASHPLHTFETDEHRAHLRAVLSDLIG